MLKIGLIREGKTPPDSRVPLTPAQCQKLQNDFPVQILVAPSPTRCYSDEEYQQMGITMQSDLSDCDVLMGVKEVPIDWLQANKTYFFFSHTIKKQSYNRPLLLAILDQQIQLIDYEVLTNVRGQRLIAFGRFAGMVGAHNAIMTYGRRTGQFELKRMHQCHDYAEAVSIYQNLQLPPAKIVLTGMGRVASGAAQVLKDMGIRQVSPQAYLQEDFDEMVFTQLDCANYATRKDGGPFVLDDFFDHPQDYKSIFHPYTQQSDIMINGIYWDNQAPAFFSQEDMKADGFKIKVIADVTCDIAPVSSIPSTIKASTIADPIFGFDPVSGQETAPHGEKVIDMMTIDNLPNELPRDASSAFGEQFIQHILPELLKENSALIQRGTVAEKGELGRHFAYLADYVAGVE